MRGLFRRGAMSSVCSRTTGEAFQPFAGDCDRFEQCGQSDPPAAITGVKPRAKANGRRPFTWRRRPLELPRSKWLDRRGGSPSLRRICLDSVP